MTEPETPIDRSVIDEARPALGPTPAQRDRLKRAVLAAAAASAAAGTAAVAGGTTAGATTAAGLGVGTKVAIAVFAIAALGGGIWWATQRPSPPVTEPVPVPVTEPATEPVPVTEPVTEPVPEPVPEPEPVTEPVPVTVAEPDAGRRPLVVDRPMVTVDPRPRVIQDFSSIERETELLREAHGAFQRGDARAALSLLDQHEDEFPRGALATERRGLRVLALCELGDAARAREEARTFLAGHPSPGLAARVQRSCAGAE